MYPDQCPHEGLALDERHATAPRLGGSYGASSFVFAGGQVAFVLLLAMLSVQARADQPSRTCPGLLTSSECAQYHHRVNHAAVGNERDRIKSEYQQLLQERLQACRCSADEDPQLLSYLRGRPGH